MQSKNAIVVVHTMASMCGMHELYVSYLEWKCWNRVLIAY